MANSAKTERITTVLKKMIARERDTVRAAHFRRMMDGPASLEALTGKTDLQRVTRNALIDALPPVKPMVDETAPQRAPRLYGFASLQAQIFELQAQLAGRGN